MRSEWTALRWSVALVFTGLLAPAATFAAPPIRVQARMLLRATGELDVDLFKAGSKPKVSNLEYGEQAREMLVTVAVGEGSERLAVTITQGKLNVTQTWKVRAGEAYGLPVAHFPVLVSPTFCGGPMTIAVKYGTQTEKRVIDFTCNE